MRVLVCGGRDYQDRAKVFAALDKVTAKHGQLEILHGACEDRNGQMRGADRWADEYAEVHNLMVIRCRADWEKYGRAAGPRRNRFMLEVWEPDAVVAFPGGDGTKGMVALAKEAGLPVWEIRE